MPLTNSSNALAANNQQPEFSQLWHPYAIDPTLAAAVAVGSVMQIGTYAGVPAGDGAYTPPYVKPSVHTSVGVLAGVMIGSGSLGAPSLVPNTIPGTANQIAMCAVSGIAQVLCDNTTVVGHTINASTTTDGCGHDSGGSTAGLTTIGVAIQAVTISSGTALVWVRLGQPF